MKKALLVLLGLAAAWGGGTAYVAARVMRTDEERARQNAAVVELGEKQAAEVRGIDSAGASLKDACAGKLPPGPARSLIEYVVRLPADERPGSTDAPRLDGLLCEVTDNGSDYLEHEPMDPPQPLLGWGAQLARAASPDDWARRLDEAAEFAGRTAQLRFVAITAFSELTPARSRVDLLGQGGVFDPGHSRYRTRVVAFPSGQTVCEGSGEGRLQQKEVIGHGGSAEDARSQLERKLGQAWVAATVASPLDDLCEAGGKSLCFATDLALDAPDW
ncbi:MAG: hypothetical protein AB1938_12775 [Myxococcota bacterium]